MNTVERYVIDTNALIYYFSTVFRQRSQLSRSTRALISQAFGSSDAGVRLSIPSVVFVEIYAKWFRAEEFARRFHYEVYLPVSESPNIEVKPIEREVVESLLRIGGELENHELHDKLILASAMTLECPLITSDTKIKRYVDRYRVIPKTLS